MDVKDENRKLKKIIKLNEMEKITNATKEGLNNMDLNKIDKKLIDILNKRDSKLEAKFTKLLSNANSNQKPKLNHKSKKVYGSHQKGQVGIAISNSKHNGTKKYTFQKTISKTNDYQSPPHLERQKGKQLQKTIPTKKTNKSTKSPQQREKKRRSRRYKKRHKKRRKKREQIKQVAEQKFLKCSKQQALRNKKEEIITNYGFVADTNLTLKQNIKKQLLNQTTGVLNNNILNPSFHNLSPTLKIPQSSATLLGLGSKFCIKTKLPHLNLRKSFSKFS